MVHNNFNPSNLPPFAVGFIQFDVKLGENERNLAEVRTGLAAMDLKSPALVVLPELWAAGFDYPRLTEHAERGAAMLAALREEAARYNIFMAGSLPERQSGTDRIFNTLYFVGPEGVTGSIRKQQLFAPMEEDRHFSPGDNPQPVGVGELGLLAGVVCYDLRFPDLIRSQAARGAQLLAVSAQWPAARRKHWQTLLKARAIENQIFVVACNRCGTSDGIEFGGHSMVVAPDGKVLYEAGDQAEQAMIAIDPHLLTRGRKLFTAVAAAPYRFHDKDKFVDLPTLKKIVANYRKIGRKVVFTNGCFDILHRGHVTYLEEARRLGDCLVVGLNSDASVRSLKGPERPLNDERSRARVLAGLGCVDHVVVFEEETPLKLICTLTPDVLVKGGDWPVEKIVGAEEVMAAGGEVHSIPLVENFSTSALVDLIRQGEER
ncbi:MAG: D-glycero-beta-D-manno-heptose 1-phosphate adenylyltransferase [Desulfobulbales bacterium]|nr:D-glycero-beta-D-manno-heptose 1-phosphate adenylyltransferase [Desulfobulbales bacterium]